MARCLWMSPDVGAMSEVGGVWRQDERMVVAAKVGRSCMPAWSSDETTPASMAAQAARREQRISDVDDELDLDFTSERTVSETYSELARRYDEVERPLLWNRPVELGMLFAFSRMVSGQLGVVGDVGCGPGHITEYLSHLELPMVGVDLSEEMIARARVSVPECRFEIGAVEDLNVEDAGWAGAVALGTLWHHESPGRRLALAELARVIRPGGVMLYGWLESGPRRPAGTSHRLLRWFDQDVSLDLHFVSIKTALREVADSGFEVISATLREPLVPHELPARRGFLLAKRK